MVMLRYGFLKYPTLEKGEFCVTGCSYPCFEVLGKLYFGIITNRRLIMFDEFGCHSIYRDEISYLEKKRKKLLLHFFDGSVIRLEADDKRIEIIKSAFENPERAKFAFLDE